MRSNSESALSGSSLAAKASSVAVVGSVLNLGMSWVLSPTSLRKTEDFLAVLAATTALFILGWILVWLPSAAFRNGLKRLREPETHSWTVIPLAALALLTPLVFWAWSARKSYALALSILVTFGLAAVWLAAAHRVRRGTHKTPRALISALRAVSVISASALIVLWLFLAKVEITNDDTGLPTGQATIISLGLLIFTSAVVLLFMKVLSEAIQRRVVIGLALVLLMSPIIARAMNSRGKAHVADGAAIADSSAQNIVLITVDTLRADSVGAIRSGLSLTPHLDNLMSQAIVFENARAPAPWTRPSMASVFTGLLPDAHRVLNRESSLQQDLTTLAEILQEAGFYTGAIGSNGVIGEGFDFDQGFDDFRIFSGSDTDLNFALGSLLLGRFGWLTLSPTTSDLADMACSWIQSHANQHFFLWLHFLDPHMPYAPPSEYSPQQEASKSLPRSVADVELVEEGELRLSEEERAWVKSLYEGEIRYVDDSIGRILGLTERLGILDETLLVVTSDHGEEFYDHGRGGHGHTLFDELLRVPLILKLPDRHRGRRLDSEVSIAAITPTIIEIAGLELNGGQFQAASLMSLIEFEEIQANEEPIISTGLKPSENRISVVLDGMKYIGPNAYESAKLFDLRVDPGEQNSIADIRSETVGEFERIVENYLSRSAEIRRQLGLREESDTELDSGQLEQLRALGYVE